MDDRRDGIRTVLIIGSGVMGRGVGALFAAGGFAVTIRNPRRDRPDDIPPDCAYRRDLPSEAPDLVIECVPEDLETKHAVFAELETAYGAAPILATNTSGLPMAEIARPLVHPARFLGMHFFTPAQVAPLVEVIRMPATAPDAVAAAVAALERCGRRALMIARPVAGHLINRLQHAMLREAYHLVEHGIATPADIDAVVKQLLGPRFCVSGLIEAKDISGLSTNLKAQAAITPHLCNRASPHPVLRERVAAGCSGLAAGIGFYDWRGRPATEVAAEAAAKLARLLDFIAAEIRPTAPPPAPEPTPRRD